MVQTADIELKTEFELGKVININKPKGMTSFGVVKKVRSLTGCKKVGHAGTLDPMATGVLLVCTGRATKQISQFVDMDKEYIGTIHLGAATDTDDAEGKVLFEKSVPDLKLETVHHVLNSFVGDIDQVPPMFSAIRQNGKRLYKIARQGKVVKRGPRNVTIHEIELLSSILPELQIRVRCSKGTYIRSLARDIGEKLGTAGYLSQLQRTRIGCYRIENGQTLDEFKMSLGVV